MPSRKQPPKRNTKKMNIPQLTQGHASAGRAKSNSRNGQKQRTNHSLKPVVVDRQPYRPGGKPLVDLTGLSDIMLVDSESVAELSEEGPDFEPEIVLSIQEVPEPDQDDDEDDVA
jgi:hypothetical protein